MTAIYTISAIVALALVALYVFRYPSKTELFAIAAVVAAIRQGIPTKGLNRDGWSLRGRLAYSRRVSEARTHADAERLYQAANSSIEQSGQEPPFGPLVRVDRKTLPKKLSEPALWASVRTPSNPFLGASVHWYVDDSPPYHSDNEAALWVAKGTGDLPAMVKT